jgi:hypothetical protein
LIKRGRRMPENMMNKAHKATNETYRNNYDKIFRKPPKKSRHDPITQDEIDEVKEEYLQKTVIGSDPPEPVKINDISAKAVIRSRRSHQDWLDSVHESHVMTDWYTDVRCPGSTPRFYGVRECVNCQYEMSEHPAGRFMDHQLKSECKGL